MNDAKFRSFLEGFLSDLRRWYKSNREIKEFYDNEDEFIDMVVSPIIRDYNAEHAHISPEQIRKFKEIYISIIEEKRTHV